MKVPQSLGAERAGPRSSSGLAGARGRFQAALLDWYRPRARPLRIRTTRDPWAILVAEVMAQQTQIARVDAAWVGFMERFPTPRAMAQASTADVLRAWSGLGYNRRALNLQRAAQAIDSDHAGRVPDTIEVLESLPGIGPYTARAIAATAYGQAVAPVDTNVRRVVSRFIGLPMTPVQLQAAADDLVYRADPAAWTHASMDLGATVCRSHRPRCHECPVSSWCSSAFAVIEPTRPRGTAIAFERSSRWLRGRIVERLRALDDGDWARLPATLGGHDESAIGRAVEALERDGLLERRSDGSVRLPSTQP
jgi:A/G-specific adenine glycosylase